MVQVAVIRVVDNGMVRLVGPFTPLLPCSSCWEGVNPVRFLGKFHEHAEALGQYILILIYKSLGMHTQDHVGWSSRISYCYTQE